MCNKRTSLEQRQNALKTLIPQRFLLAYSDDSNARPLGIQSASSKIVELIRGASRPPPIDARTDAGVARKASQAPDHQCKSKAGITNCLKLRCTQSACGPVVCGQFARLLADLVRVRSTVPAHNAARVRNCTSAVSRFASRLLNQRLCLLGMFRKFFKLRHHGLLNIALLSQSVLDVRDYCFRKPLVDRS